MIRTISEITVLVVVRVESRVMATAQPRPTSGCNRYPTAYRRTDGYLAPIYESHKSYFVTILSLFLKKKYEMFFFNYIQYPLDFSYIVFHFEWNLHVIGYSLST